VCHPVRRGQAREHETTVAHRNRIVPEKHGSVDRSIDRSNHHPYPARLRGLDPGARRRREQVLPRLEERLACDGSDGLPGTHCRPCVDLISGGDAGPMYTHLPTYDFWQSRTHASLPSGKLPLPDKGRTNEPSKHASKHANQASLVRDVGACEGHLTNARPSHVPPKRASCGKLEEVGAACNQLPRALARITS
jgi:hypothetical protein